MTIQELALVFYKRMAVSLGCEDVAIERNAETRDISVGVLKNGRWRRATIESSDMMVTSIDPIVERVIRTLAADNEETTV